MKNSQLISVILPVFNQEKYIGEAIESILNQSYQEFELVIVNDHSTDRTSEIIKNYQDSRIRTFTTKKNLKLATLLNTYITKCKGKYIARMDADDLSMPNRLETQLSFLENNPEVDLVGGYTELFGHKAGKIWKYPLEHESIKTQLLFSNPISHPVAMFRKSSWIKKNIAYDAHFFRYQDYKLWTEAIDLLIFANIPEVLIKHRVYKDQLDDYYSSVEKNNLRLQIWKSILEKKLNIKPTSKQLKIHSHLADLSIPTSDYSIDDYYDWISRLQSANQKTKYYNQKELEQTLETFWYLSGFSTQLSLPQLFKFLRTPLSRSVSNYKKYKLVRYKLSENLVSLFE